MNIRQFLVVLLALVFTLPAAATTITQTSGVIDLLVLQDASTTALLGFDVRNTASFSIASGPLTGGFFVTDGTPIGFPSPAVPNSAMIALNGAVTEGIIVTFGNFRSPSTGVALLDVTFASNLTGVTDPILQYLTANVTTMAFSYVPDSAVLIENDTQVLSSWVSTGMTGPDVTAPIPEPATFALFGVGMIGLVALRRRRS